jgi:transposase
MNDTGLITRNGDGKVEGRKSHLEKNPELEGLLKKYRKTMTYDGISSVLLSEHGMKVSKSSVPNLLKEIELKKKERRNRLRRVS